MDIPTFEKLIQTHPRPLIVDVWAPWCGPCRHMNPIFQDLAEVYAGRVDLIKVNADESQALVRHLGILGIPTTLVYRQGEELGRRTGAMSRAELAGLFEAALASGPVRIPVMSPRTRLLRLFLTLVFLVMGIVMGPIWIFGGFALLTLLWAIYDYIPGATALQDRMIRKLLNAAAANDDAR